MINDEDWGCLCLNLSEEIAPDPKDSSGNEDEYDRIGNQAQTTSVCQYRSQSIDAIDQGFAAQMNVTAFGRLCKGNKAPDRKKVGITRKFIIS